MNQPRNVQEQIVWDDVMKNPASGRELRNLNGDSRFPQDAGFVKMERIVRTVEGKILLFIINIITLRKKLMT